MDNLGKFSEYVNPAVDQIAYFTYMTGASNAVAWQPAIAMYNARTNTIIGSATIDSYDSATSGQAHDWPFLLPGPNGEMLIPYGAISLSSGTRVLNCMTSNGTATGTSLACQPFKMALPTSSPSAIAASTTLFLPNPRGESEGWSVCWRMNPGDVDTYANESQRCIHGGQSQFNPFGLNGSANFAQLNNQNAMVLHWTVATPNPGIVYVDTVATPAPPADPACPVVNCYGLTSHDSYTAAIGNATNAAIQLTADSGDNDWAAWTLNGACGAAGTAACTSAVAGTVVFPTLPNNGEFNANTQCTIGFTTSATETALQMAQDTASIFNTGAAITGTSPSRTAGCTSQVVNYAMYVSTGCIGKAATCSATVSATGTQGPTIVLQLRGCSTYSTQCDIRSTGYQQNNLGATSCSVSGTFCTMAAAVSLGGYHATLGFCKLLEGWGETGLCMFDIDHTTTSFNKTASAGSDFGQELMLMCFNKTSYSTSTQQVTFRTCNPNGTQTSFTVGAGNGLASSNPANSVAGGQASGQGTATNITSQSPWLMQSPAPAATPANWVNPMADWISTEDPDITGLGYFACVSWDGTNLPNGNLFIVLEQCTSNPVTTHYLMGCSLSNVTLAVLACQKITTDVLSSSGNYFQVNVQTGASGAIYIVVNTGTSTAHGCSGACMIEYTDPNAFLHGNVPQFNFAQAVSLGGAGGQGQCPGDQQGGYHVGCVMIWGALGNNNANNLSAFDFYTP